MLDALSPWHLLLFLLVAGLAWSFVWPSPPPLRSPVGPIREKLPAALPVDGTASYFQSSLPSPQLPADWAHDVPPIDVASASMPGQNFRVDLSQRTCTCPDFQKLRANFATQDVRRLCKHAQARLQDLRLHQLIEPPLRALLLEERISPHHTYLIDQVGKTLVIHQWDGGAWFNTYLPSASIADSPAGPREYERFGYNLNERRWAYQENPRWVPGITKRIRELAGR